MSADNDVTRLANLLKEQRDATITLAATRDPATLREIAVAVQRLRNECLALVDRYSRQTLRPVLAKRFPGKGIQSAPQNQQVHSNDAMFRYTELIYDFFVQVLSRFDDPFWTQDSAIELRNYASICVSNNGVRDVLRQRRKKQPLTDEQVRDSFEDQLATDIQTQFARAQVDIDPADALKVLNEWDHSCDETLQKYAMLLRHVFVSGMTMEQIAADMKTPVKTLYRWRATALTKMRNALNKNHE